MKHGMQKLAALLGAILLLTLSVCAGSLQYLMTLRGGRVCVLDVPTGRIVCETPVCEDNLSPHDRLLLEKGLALQSQAEYTSALEDFCS